MSSFSDLSAVIINCSITKNKKDSHTQKLIDRFSYILRIEGVTVEDIYAMDHRIAFGMIKNGADVGLTDEWPELQKRILTADILVIATPIWLGVKSSLATLVIERLYAYSSDANDKGQYIYYGKTGGCLITGNEDGIKHCAMDMLFALQHIGYMIPPQADAGWIGEVGPGPSYGDQVDGTDVPKGFDNEFTNQNTTIMAWNLMHTAKMLKDAGGIPALGNTKAGWKNATNAQDYKIKVS
ncbi:MAG: NAD(P)H-dependent oxidoreductase [Candidatus Saccharimonadales bacterium]